MTRLEDELQTTTPFANNRQKVIVNLVYTYGVFLERTLMVLHDFDINDQHFNILKTLNEHYPEPLPVGEIRRLLFNKRGDLTRLLDKLTTMELIERDTDPEDRRVVLVAITDKGREQVKAMDERIITERDAQIALSEEEAQQLNELLDKLRG
jgi:DNA-binding MarR family transcriptional regulator